MLLRTPKFFAHLPVDINYIDGKCYLVSECKWRLHMNQRWFMSYITETLESFYVDEM